MYLYKAIIFDWENCLAQTRSHPVMLANGAERFLHRLSEAGVKLAILTNGQPSILDRYASFDQIRSLFSVIVTAQDTSHYKPHPEGVEKIMDQLGVTAEETLLIGDSESDMAAAQAVSADSALYLGEGETVRYSDRDTERMNPTYTVRGFAELHDLIYFKQ